MVMSNSIFNTLNYKEKPRREKRRGSCVQVQESLGYEATLKTSSSKASSQDPCVEALEYSVARFSKKLVCSAPFSIASIQGSGFFWMPNSGLRPSWVRRRSPIYRM